jgi:hypothetical protein
MARNESLTKPLEDRRSPLVEDRKRNDTLRNEIASLVIPRKATFLEVNASGVERNREVLDSTAPRALELFVSFLADTMSNPSRKWIIIGDEEREMDKLPTEHKQWIGDAERKMMARVARRDFDIYSAMTNVYENLGAFGPGPLIIDQRGSNVRAIAPHVAEIAISEDDNGRIDTLFWSKMHTGRQILSTYGGLDLSSELRKKAEQARNQREFEVVHAFIPNDPADSDIINQLPEQVKAAAAVANAPYLSIKYLPEFKEVLTVGFFHEQPFMVPRWYRSADSVYGRSPAMTVFPDIRMVNRMTETILRGAEKLVDPPLLIPDGGLISPIRLMPGGISYSDGAIVPQPLVPPGASRIEVGDALLRQKQDAIRDGFFVPLFMNVEQPVKTATQILQEKTERDRAAAPMLTRLQAELFHVLIPRIFGIMRRTGEIPAPPQGLDERRLKIEYVSPLVASQREFEALATGRLFETMAPWAQVDEGVMDWVDMDTTAQVLFEASQVPPKMLKTPGKVKKLREQRNEQLQAEQQAAIAAQQGATAADLITAAKK